MALIRRPELATERVAGALDFWQLAASWIGAIAVIGAALWLTLVQAPPSAGLIAIGVTFGLMVLTGQVLATRHAVDLLRIDRQREVQMRDQTKLVTELFNRAPIGILRVGTDFKVIDSNPVARAIVRTDINKHSSVTDYMTPQERQRVGVLMRPLMAGETENIEAEQDGRRADGSRMRLHWSLTAIRKPGGAIDYLLVVMEDITVKHDNEEAARANTEALERLNKLKSEFTSMVSHEFRTALTGIQGYSEMMATHEVTPKEVKEFSSDINSEALRLNRMITEMLDLDRIESGRIDLRLESVDINRLVSDAMDRARITTKTHVMVADLDVNAPRVQADRDRLGEVVGNLLNNAVKYSPNGGEIVVSTLLTNDALEVCVKDHGQGIPPEFISRIFTRYERYEAAGKPAIVGTGLGLAISKEIVRLHHGEIWVESKVGEGSQFHFTIPIGQSSVHPEPVGRVA